MIYSFKYQNFLIFQIEFNIFIGLDILLQRRHGSYSVDLFYAVMLMNGTFMTFTVPDFPFTEMPMNFTSLATAFWVPDMAFTVMRMDVTVICMTFTSLDNGFYSSRHCFHCDGPWYKIALVDLTICYDKLVFNCPGRCRTWVFITLLRWKEVTNDLHNPASIGTKTFHVTLTREC